MDANWRWVHKEGTYTPNCYDGSAWNSELCSTVESCTENCALDGVPASDDANTYGIATEGSEVRLKLKTGTNVGSRTYLMDDDENYYLFKLLNKEFTFDVDVSGLPCGLNGAMYFVEMPVDGGKSKYSGNKAGAAYGTGYCDA